MTLQCSPVVPTQSANIDRLRSADVEISAWSFLSDDSVQGNERDVHHWYDMPFGVKDVIDVAGMPTSFGATDRHVRLPYADAWCVAALRQAGAVPIGKTVTAEFAFRSPGPTKNPCAPTHTPGGSSSGSAAAVAAGMVRAALSTQTGGSIIRPAAYCGVPGFKPTFGLLPRNGLFITCESLDVIGWHSVDYETMDAFAEVLLPLEKASSGKGVDALRYVVADWNSQDTADEEARAELGRVLHRLSQAGAARIKPDVSHQTIETLMDAHDVIMHFEFARSLYPVVANRPEGISDHVVQAIDIGLSLSDREYLRFRDIQEAHRRSWETVSHDADLIITFSASGAAPEGHAFTGNAAFCKPWSVTGWPVVHIPTARNKDGLPLGIQLVGPPGTDRTLIQWAEKIRQTVSI